MVTSLGRFLTGSPIGGLELIETKLIGVDTSSVTFSGLDGNNDGVYILRGFITHGALAGGNHQTYVRPNGLTTNQSQTIADLNVAYSGSTAANVGWYLAQTNFNNPDRPCQFDARIDPATGKWRMFRNYMSIGSPLQVSGWWTDLAANITSLDVDEITGNHFGAGSIISLYKQKL